MLITSWVLLVCFGAFAINGFINFFFGSLNWFHAIFWFVSIIVTAISAGVIWGGLLSNVG